MPLIVPKRKIFVPSAPPLIRPRRWLPDVRRRIVPMTMGVTVDATTAGWTDVTTTPLTISNLTTTAAANAIIVHLIGGSGSAFPAGLSLVWDQAGANQPFTQVPNSLVAQASMAATGAVFALLAPTSFGNKNILISWTGAFEMHACAMSLRGVDQTSIAVSFPNGNTNQANSGTSPCTVTITSAVGNIVTASHGQNTSAWGAVSGTTLSPSDLIGPSIGVISNYDVGASPNVTLTAAFPTTPSDRMSCGCDILAAAAVMASGPPDVGGYVESDW